MSEKVTTVSVAGINVAWTSSDADYEKLQENLEAGGYGSLVIDKKSSRAALSDALHRVFSQRHRRLIRPLGRKVTGYGVYEERIEDDGESLAHIEMVRVKIDSQGHLVFEGENFESIANQTNGAQKQAAMQALTLMYYQEELGKVSHNQVTQLFVKALNSLGGIRLLRRGGMYWLNQDKVEEWCNFFPCVTDAACSPGSIIIHRQNVVMDDDAWKTVSAALHQDINTKLEGIRERVESGTVKDRGLQSLANQASDLHSTIEQYENMFDKVLEELHDAADEASETASLAQIELEASLGV